MLHSVRSLLEACEVSSSTSERLSNVPKFAVLKIAELACSECSLYSFALNDATSGFCTISPALVFLNMLLLGDVLA